MAPILSVRNLHVRFETREGTVQAINGVSFDLDAGEVLGILGESGSGKSVSLRALVALLPAERTRLSGEIWFEGMNLAGLPERDMNQIRGAKIAMIFQEPMIALDPVFTIGEQIAESIVRHEGVSWQTATGRARDLLDRVRIPSAARRLKSYPHEMSGGMRQRAMVALALACRPQILLADEPTTALDVTVQIQIILLLRELQRELGMAVIFVTHDVGVAAEISDRIAVMYGGRFVEHGPVVNVIEQPRHPYTAGLLSSTVHGSRRGQRLDTIPGMPPDLTRLGDGCAFAPRCRYAEDRCVSMLPELAIIDTQHASACLRIADGSLTLDDG
jgi:peptide/nickel transport system ATP-binding protein